MGAVKGRQFVLGIAAMMETTKLANRTRKRVAGVARDVMNSSHIISTLLSLTLIVMFSFLNIVKQIWSPVFRLLFAARNPVVVRTPEDRFINAGLDELGYTYASNYINIPFGIGRANDRPRMHYLDESPNGDRLDRQKIALCLHGLPTWSFTYRRMIPKLVEAGYRVIVPDSLGFGKSDKYVDKDNYNHEMHTFAIKHLINELGLGNNITLIGLDFGAIVGLSIVKDMPDRFSALVMMNTGVPTGFGEEFLRRNFLENVRDFVPFFAWRSAITFFGAKFPLVPMFQRLFGLNSGLAKAYNAPFPDAAYKGGLAKWPLTVPVYRDDAVAQHMVEVKSCLRVWDKPVLMMWGENETVTKPYQRVFAGLMPQAQFVTIKKAGHFMLETHADETICNVQDFLNKIDRSDVMSLPNMMGGAA